MSAGSLVKGAALTVFTGLLVHGLTRRDGPFSWPMFVGIQLCRMDLTRRADNGERVPINAWRFMDSIDPHMGLVRFTRLLDYLRRVHGLRTDGWVVYVDRSGATTIKVVDGDLDF